MEGKVLLAGSYIIATEELIDEQRNSIVPSDFSTCDMNVALDHFRLSGVRTSAPPLLALGMMWYRLKELV